MTPTHTIESENRRLRLRLELPHASRSHPNKSRPTAEAGPRFQPPQRHSEKTNYRKLSNLTRCTHALDAAASKGTARPSHSHGIKQELTN